MKIRVGLALMSINWWQGANFGWAVSAWNMKGIVGALGCGRAHPYYL